MAPIVQKRLPHGTPDSNERSSKRQKSNSDANIGIQSPLARTGFATNSLDTNTSSPKFQPGAVVRVKMTNFVTYKSIEYHLGDSLNMIIGPNGSGKSTFVCALCLGLYGKPEILGRSTKLSDFVKIGCDEATIEIELQNHPGEPRIIVIKRVISSTGTNQWYARGRKTTANEVQELLAGFKMQIDNICQFLPQDKVASFSQSSPQELLLNTERAIGSKEMVDQHTRLKELAESLLNSSAGTSTDEAKLARLQEEHRHDEAVIEEIRNFEQSQELLEKSNKALKLSELGDRERDMVQCQANVTACKDRVEQQRQDFEPLNQRIIQSSNDYVKFYEEYHKVTSQIDKDVAALNRVSEKIRDNVSDSQLYKRQYKELLSRKLEHERNIQRYRAAVEYSKAEVEKLLGNKPEDPYEGQDISRLMDELKDNISVVQGIMDDSKRKLSASDRIYQRLQNDSAHLEKRLADIQSGQQQRLDALRGYDMKSAKAVELFRYTTQSKGEGYFKESVILPAILNLEIKDPTCAKYIGAVLRKIHLSSFVTQDYSDYRKLSDLLLDGDSSSSDTRATIFQCSPQEALKINPPIPREQLKQYGFDGYLLDLLIGPPALIGMLCNEASVHAIPYSKQPLSDSQKRALNSLRLPGNRFPFKTYIDGNTSVTVTFSRFGKKEPTFRYQRLKPSSHVMNLMAGAAKSSSSETSKWKEEIRLSKNRIAEERNKQDSLREEENEANGKRLAYETQLNAIKNVVHDSRSWRQSLQKKRAEADRREEALNVLISQEPNTQGEQEEVSRNYSKALEAAVEISESHAELARNLNKLQSRRVHLEFARLRSKNEERVLRRYIDVLLNESIAELREAEEELRRATEKHRSQKREVSRAITAEELPSLERYLEETYPAAASATSEIRNKCAQLEAELHVTGEVQRDSERVMQQYEKRAELIDKLTETINAASASRELLKNEVEAIQNEWEPKLDDMIASVSHSFSEAFAAIKCKGQVLLDKPYKDGIPQFKDWAINIMVSFREEAPLQQLTAQRQSGGERAVSTVLYLMALQHQALAPFRVVDEINQGMDPANERMVHNRMVEVACKENTSQYFLVTPKLLPNLEYHKKMKVLCIFSGKHVKYHGGVKTTTRRVLDIMRKRKSYADEGGTN